MEELTDMEIANLMGEIETTKMLLHLDPDDEDLKAQLEELEQQLKKVLE